MHRLQTLLLALLLPVLLLPDGMTICVCELLHERATSTCCDECCRDEPPPAAATVNVAAAENRDCCIALEHARATTPPEREHAAPLPPLPLDLLPWDPTPWTARHDATPRCALDVQPVVPSPLAHSFTLPLRL